MTDAIRADQPMPPSPGRRDELHDVWYSPGGVYGWFTHVNQRMIGKRFIITAFVFFLLAGATGILMRIQLSFPENDFLDPELYNQLFTRAWHDDDVPLRPTGPWSRSGCRRTPARRASHRPPTWCSCSPARW